MKKLLILLMLNTIVMQSCFAVTFDEIKKPMPNAYRTGLSDTPEKEYTEAKSTNPMHQEYVKKDVKQFTVNDLTYADLSIKQISKEVAADLQLEQDELVGDLCVLWQGAASQSDTINFALYKLANPDENKPNDKSVKKVLTTIASMSTLAGATFANPAIAAGQFWEVTC